MVKEKNPYENTGTIDIPTFGEKKKETTESIDLSVLKLEQEEIEEMKEDNNYDEEIDEEEDEEEEEEERAPRKINVGRVVILVETILLIAMAVLLALTVFSANKKATALKAAEEKYDSYVKKAESNEASYKQTIADLEAKIAAATTPGESSGGGSSSSSTSGTKYKIVGDGIRVRTGAGTSYSTASVSSLPSNLVARDEPYLYAGETVTVLETAKDSSGNTWGKIGNNAWFCISYNGTSYATAQ